MRSGRRNIVFILLIVLPFTSWAGSIVPCAQNDQAASSHFQNESNAHAHHGTGQADAAVGETEGPLTDIDCCDECAMACPGSGGSATAIISENVPPAISGNDHKKSFSGQMHNSPDPDSLFRPPIQVSK